MKNIKIDYVPRWAMSLSDDKWLNKLSTKVKAVCLKPGHRKATHAQTLQTYVLKYSN